MRRANTVLAVILAILIGAGVYFIFGTRMRAEVTLAREGDVLVCEMTLKNGSLFPYEYLEFIASPDPSVIAGTEGAGENVGILSEKAAKVTLNLPAGQETTIEIGYYVLGLRKTIQFSVP